MWFLVMLLMLPLSNLQAHDFYKDWKQFNGASCCSNQDCEPVDERIRNGQYEAFIKNKWIIIPDSKVRKEPSPDGQSHVCFTELQDGSILVYCYQPGMGS